MSNGHEELDISGVKIAVIDDAKTIRMMMTHTLRGMGCEVECAEDGYKALGMLRRFKPDLIFLDITMPELDGYETTRRIRERERASGGRRLPIVALTAHAFEGERERCLEAGMDDYLSKPFRIGDLDSLLEKWLHAGVPYTDNH